MLVGSRRAAAAAVPPALAAARGTLAASALVVLGAFAWLFVFIIGGQAFPLEIFPGHAVSSSFADGAVEHYRPSLPELLLGLGGLGAAFLLTTVGVRVLDFMPQDDYGAGSDMNAERWTACSSRRRTSRRARRR